MSDAPTWYDLLDVPRGASAEDVRAAWKTQIADLEPGDRRFDALNRAAKVLLDPGTRAAYDASLPAEEDVEPTPVQVDEHDEPTPEPVEAVDTAVPAGTGGVPSWLLAGLGVLAAGLLAATAWMWTSADPVTSWWRPRAWASCSPK
jgi:Mce-associated membrane protein